MCSFKSSNNIQKSPKLAYYSQKWEIIFTIIIMAMAFLIVSTTTAYTIDGDLSDWGLSHLKTGDWGETETWCPSDGISYIVEDNANPCFSHAVSGVHITGVGSKWKFFDEQLKRNSITNEGLIEPCGGEAYDVEAFYFDQDADCLYIAIVTSLKPDGSGDRCPMDLAMNVGIDSGMDGLVYEYGVIIHDGPMQGSIISQPEWDENGWFYPKVPGNIKGESGLIVGYATMAYTDEWLERQDNGFENYVIELAILRDAIGGYNMLYLENFYYGDSNRDDIIITPEFPGIAVSLAFLIGMVFVIYMIWPKKQ